MRATASSPALRPGVEPTLQLREALERSPEVLEEAAVEAGGGLQVEMAQRGEASEPLEEPHADTRGEGAKDLQTCSHGRAHGRVDPRRAVPEVLSFQPGEEPENSLSE